MGDGMGSDMGGGMGNGMGSGMGYGMGSGMGSGMGNGMGGGMDYGYTDMPYGSGMGGMGYGMGGDCCPRKKIWGSMNQKMDGMYVNVGKMPWGKLPRRCNSDCVYERMGSYDGLKYCFGDSMYSQSECDADMGDGEEPVDMGPGDDMGSGYGDMGSGSDGESPVDMGPGEESGMGSGSEGENPVDMGSGSGSGGEDPVTMGPGSGSEDPVDMGSGSGGEDPVTMGPGSGSGSGALCPMKVMMMDCNIDCLNASPDPATGQLFISSEVGIPPLFSTNWTIFADNDAPKITLNCEFMSSPIVTECKDGEWTVSQELKDLCGTMDGEMEGHGSGSGDDGMMDHGSSSGTTDDGMMDHGSGDGGMMDHGSNSGSADEGMMDHGSGDDGMMDHGSSSGSGDGGMGDHSDGGMGDHSDGGMGDHNGRH